MKRKSHTIIVSLLSLFALLLFAHSCKKTPQVFDINGQWGVSEVTYIIGDAEPTHCEELKNHYYAYWTFQINGVLSVKMNLDDHVQYGDYVYNANKRELLYIYEGFTRYIPADVAIVSPTEMILTAHLTSSTTIYHMKKLKW